MPQSFILLKDLLKNLDSSELKNLKRKVILKAAADDRKSLKLINTILINPEISAEECEKKVYGSKDKAAFPRLVNRIIEKIDDIYITFNYSSINLFQDRNYYYFYLKRKLLMLQMRWLRGISNDLYFQFGKISSIAIKYELYEVLIDSLRVKQRLIAVHSNPKVIFKIENEIIRIERLKMKVDNARNLWTIIGSKIVQSSSSAKYFNELNGSVETLRKDYLETKSPLIGFYYYLLSTELLQSKNKFLESEQKLIKLNELLIKSPSVYTATRNGDVLINIANNKIYLGDFLGAISLSEQARKFFAINPTIITLH